VSRRTALGAAALVALVLAAYVPALSAGFIWDDDRHVTGNLVLKDTLGLAAAWTTLDATPQYYPLTHTTFWLEHALWGLDPRGYHLTNVLLHAAAAILVWRLLLLLEVPGAWLAAAVFALHPVHVESVAWVSERKNVLSAVLYLGAARVFLGWVLGRERGTARPWIATALYIGALLAKTVTATLPIALAVALWWKRGRIDRRELAWLAPMLVIGAAFGGVTHRLEQTQVGAAGSEWQLSVFERVALSGRIVTFYLGKLAWPSPLVFIYPRWPTGAGAFALTWTAVVSAGAAALWLGRRTIGRGPVAALAFFVVTLAPALGFFDVYPMRYSWVADHFQYLASLGPIVLAAAGIALVCNRLAPRRALAVAAVVLTVVLGVQTFARAHVYENEEMLWRDTLAQNPEAWIAHDNLGIILAESGRNDEAARHFRRVLELRPMHSGARANLGYLQELGGQDAEAAATLAQAAAERPDDADVRARLVRVLVRLGRFDEALPYAVEAARLRPGDPEVVCDAGTLLARAGRTAEAIPLLEHALALRPGFPRAAANLVLARRQAADVGYPPPAQPKSRERSP
jgi:protein O-mannosyl-transferase